MTEMEDISKTLEIYLEKIKNNSISSKELILLLEFFVKNKLVENNELVTINTDEWMKYAFLGYWIYSNLNTR